MILSEEYLINVVEIYTRTSEFHLRSDKNLNGFGINKEKGILSKFDINDIQLNVKRDLVPEGDKKHEGHEMIYLVLYSSAWLSQKTEPQNTTAEQTPTNTETNTKTEETEENKKETVDNNDTNQESTKETENQSSARVLEARVLETAETSTIIAVSEHEIDENLQVKKGVAWWIWLIIALLILAIIILLIVIIICCCKCCKKDTQEDKKKVYQPKPQAKKPREERYKVKDDAKTANEDGFSFPNHVKEGDSKVHNNIEEKKFAY